MSSQKARRVSQRKRQQRLKSVTVMGVGGLLLILVAVWLVKSTQPTAKAAVEVKGAPSLKVDKENVDLGKVQLGKTVDVAFTLTNVGDQPLKLSEAPYVEVVEGCWPPTPTIGSMVLQPGDTTRLDMQFMMHEGMDGKHDFRVHIPSNDPKHPDKTVEVLSDWGP